MIDETEPVRRARFLEIQEESLKARSEFEQKYGRVWNTDELSADFHVIGFSSPFVVVRRKSDGKKGSLEFAHNPRFYFNWEEA